MRMGLCASRTQILPIPSVVAASVSASNISCDRMAGPEEFACSHTLLQQLRPSNGVCVGQEVMKPNRVSERAHWPTLSDGPQLFKRASESAYLAGIVETAARRLLFE